MGVPRDLVAEVWRRSDGRCFYCGNELGPRGWSGDGQEFVRSFTIDHGTPPGRGGGETVTNLIAACMACNARKRDRTVEEYREYLARKLTRDVDRAISDLEACCESYPRIAVPLEAALDALIATRRDLLAQHPVVFHGERSRGAAA